MTQVSVQPVTMAHAKLMHSWRNHPATRSVSRNSEAIAYEDHLRWLSSALGDSQRLLLVGSSEGRPIGFVRFDFHAPDLCEVSIFLNPALHGQGYGFPLLLAGEAFMMEGRGRVRIIAETIEGNAASRRLFEKAGYEWRNGRFEKELG